jgi:hypothetical protein
LEKRSFRILIITLLFIVALGLTTLVPNPLGLVLVGVGLVGYLPYLWQEWLDYKAERDGL